MDEADVQQLEEAVIDFRMFREGDMHPMKIAEYVGSFGRDYPADGTQVIRERDIAHAFPDTNILQSASHETCHSISVGRIRSYGISSISLVGEPDPVWLDFGTSPIEGCPELTATI